MDRPVFPLDLKREIFETMALLHPSQIPTLLRVARRVLCWIEPLLYRTLRITESNPGMARAHLKAMKSKPPVFFRAVRHIILDSSRILPLADSKDLLRA
ncbi:hypothetical protein DFH06DRAFT_1012088 [Mycena polygramma]|nr:hypothetical protein DFH06DRAFT_1012088 [Mycena polygramma]